MIESCQKRRMLIGISFLGALTVLVLIVESHWTDGTGTRRKKIFPAIENNSTCWKRETYTVIQDCHPCTDFEIASQSIGVCIHTNFKEILRCASGETVTRSCDKVAWLEERSFWTFQGSTFIIAVISTTFVIARKRVLNRRMLVRMQKQLANSV